MADKEHLAWLHAGVDAWNAWRKEHPDIAPDLSEANLCRANLVGINFGRTCLGEAYLGGVDLETMGITGEDLKRLSGVNLTSANLKMADLSDANLSDANLSDANLSDANLTSSNLEMADLSAANLSDANLNDANVTSANLEGADLNEAKLTGTNFKGAILRRANLRGALLIETVFVNVDLRETKGLDACWHWGPSALDHRTLQRSGQLPLSFLRGCGLSDPLIKFLSSLREEEIQYYSCFISHSSKDEAFARRLHEGLQNNGVRCWFAPHDLPIGAKIREQIDIEIEKHDKVLLILSKRALASDWVDDEVTKAFAEERRRGQVVLFPVQIDETILKTGEAWAVKLREQRNIGDFRKWKDHDAFQQAFARVLRDLKVVPG